MIPFYVLALWLQMSAQPQTIKYEPALACVCSEFENDQANGKQFANGSSPNCGEPANGKEYVATCWETKRAADETDGLHECKDEADSNCVRAKCCDDKVKGADETDGKPLPSGDLTVAQPKCIQRPAADGCNTETVCDGVATSVTLVACMKSPYHLTTEVAAYPVDVPAVQEFGGHIPNVDDRRKCVDGSRRAESGVACLTDRVWSCKEKSRVLQFSEDGKKHCIKL